MGSSVTIAPTQRLSAILLVAFAAALPAQTPKITVSPKTATIEVGKTKQLSRTVTVVWASSDTTIAIVSQTGWVTAVRPGIAQITVAAGGSLVATSTVTIVPVAVASVTVTFSKASMLPGEKAKYYVTLRDRDGNVLTGRKPSVVTSSNTSVLRILPTIWADAAAWPRMASR
jgi:uncharacterized protein YjdB